MRNLLSFICLFAIPSLALAQIPVCAVPCLEDAVKSVGCVATDFTCSCKPENQEKIQGEATGCVLSACGLDVALNQVLPAAQEICNNLAAAPSVAVPTSSTALGFTSGSSFASSTASITPISSSSVLTATPTGSYPAASSTISARSSDTKAAGTSVTSLVPGSSIVPNSAAPNTSVVPFQGASASLYLQMILGKVLAGLTVFMLI